ncbi:hypothetical protein DL93DRAFT_2127165 [Clavulina sp. PMI_390]|nr:hypothetical protein DL93DRAFT_2127165 [Clavulina sp. PMI_390]
MLDEMDQYSTFSNPYGLYSSHLDPFDMKRTQDSIGGPETVKKARKYSSHCAAPRPPLTRSPLAYSKSSLRIRTGLLNALLAGYDLQPQSQNAQAFYQAGPQLNSAASAVPSSPANIYASSLNGSIAAPPVLNTMAMNMNGIPMNGLNMSGLNGMNMNSPLQQQPSPLVSSFSAAQMNGSMGQNNMAGMMPPPSPNPAGLSSQQQQQLFAAAQQLQQGSQTTPSPNSQQQFLQQQQQQMLAGGMGLAGANGMGMVPGMFGAMPMGLGFPFGQMGFAAAAAAAGNQTGRTVYIGNLPADASVDELLNLVHYGPIESVRVLPERSCVFISFLDGSTAASFHTEATIKKLALHGQELKIGWGKPSPVPSQVLLSISQSNASRNVYLGGLDENMTEEMLRDDLSRFGLIDQVKIVRDKNIGFVHFLSISTATKVVATLPTEPQWAGKRVNYGKDRCAYVPKSQQSQPQTPAAMAAQGVLQQQAAMTPLGMNFNPFTPLTSTFSPIPNIYASPDPSSILPNPAAGMTFGPTANRTVYLGNIHPDTNIEELCNTIRGGAIQSIRYMADKHIAFVTFIDPASAYGFHHLASTTGLTLNNRRLKVGWGKPSGPLPSNLALSIQAGATRNVYVGNIEDFEKFSVEKLKRDFGEYGEIELVNYLKEKNCAFVNFTNISNAIKAIDGIKSKPEYANLRVAHGKDRCANAPRQGSGSGMRRTSGNNNGQASPQPPLTPNDISAIVEADEGADGEGAQYEDDAGVPEDEGNTA